MVVKKIAIKKLDGVEDKDMLFLYLRVVYFWECNSNESYKIKENKFQDYIKDKNIDIQACKKSEMDKASVENKKLYDQYFIFYNDESSQAAGLIKRIRNATAHCNLARKKISSRWFYKFTDYDNNGNCTMTGKIGNSNFKQFIEYLLQTKQS